MRNFWNHRYSWNGFFFNILNWRFLIWTKQKKSDYYQLLLLLLFLFLMLLLRLAPKAIWFSGTLLRANPIYVSILQIPHSDFKLFTLKNLKKYETKVRLKPSIRLRRKGRESWAHFFNQNIFSSPLKIRNIFITHTRIIETLAEKSILRV